MPDKSQLPSQDITHARVWRLAGPIILSNISVPLLGMVDTAVMGHLPSPAYLGGVAIGAMIFSFVFWSFGFLRMATTGFIAQAHGAGDDQEIRDTALRAALLAVALGLFVIALQWPIKAGAFAIVEASDEVERLGRAYFDIRIWSAPATLLVYAGVGWLVGMQRTGTVLGLTILMNGINILLDLVFVLGFGWDIEGVALATVIAEWTVALLGGLVILRIHGKFTGHWRLRAALARDRLIAMFRVNFDIFLRTLCLISAFAWFTAQGAVLGDTQLAANHVLMNFASIAGHGLDGLAFAAETLVGAAIGARDRRGYRLAIKRTTLWAGLIAAGLSLIFFFGGSILINILTGLPVVRNMAEEYLIWAALIPIFGVWSYQLDGIYIGATRTAEMRNGMALSLVGFLAVGYAFLSLWGNHGLWAALLLFMTFRAVTLGLWLPRIERSMDKS